MKILLVVHNLIREKSHLMPWRTVCDVVKHLREEGHVANLISLGDEKSELHGGIIPAGTQEIPKHLAKLEEELCIEVERFKPDAIFWPTSWREAGKRLKIAASFGIPVVLWFPGGVYSVGAGLYALKVLGFQATLPYLLESVSSRRKKVKLFKRYGVKGILTMTQETANSAIAGGWPESKCFVVPPGKENEHPAEIVQPLSSDFKNWLGGRPYYLFLGPPSGIRGIFELIKAFDIAAEQDNEICLVCLFRADAALDTCKVKETIERCKNKARIFSIWDSLCPEELNGFMASCHAVAMPFVLVPSEIPLAIIEAMAFGKPIISTTPGGTGAYVKKYGLAPMVGDVDGLAEALLSLYEDKRMYAGKCAATEKYYRDHPCWREVANSWLKVAKKAAS